MPTLPIDGGTLWYEEQGSGQPLVCLHGGWSNSNFWGPQVERFARDHRVITFDMRGHGRTGATETQPYTIDHYVDDLERLLAHLGVDQPLFFGFSLGGMVAQSYMARHPNGARGAVISGPLQSMPPIPIPSTMKPFVSPIPMISSMASTMGPTATFQTLLASIRTTTGRQWLTLDPQIRSRALEAVGQVSPKEYGKIFQAMYQYEPADMSHVQSPILVLYGDHEAPPVKRQGQKLATNVGNGSWEEIPDAGHLVNLDRPQAFNAAAGEFFDSLGRQAPVVQ